ncbi:conserved protein of unknown function [Petrocella atlantisensis]|uniref:DUF5666 domain-containing protein n=1 Tax=Petrocella atlantisensis TaxID=2173034 RepID=A0A3P7S2K9_9FIRM|nr:hypothetical protein [Petrocella atlantisensis]MCF8019423.1 hypothetical protein [Vallitaleaceae bacterium]VDN46999.1 conserved protein of unknown function [Petrocella atlantisensis]
MKKWMIFGILIIVVGLFSGCFNSKPEVMEEEQVVSDVVEEEMTEEPSEEVTEEATEDTLPEEEPAMEEELEEDMETTTGIYVGQIDSNSIEVEITDISAEDTFKAFRFSETVKANFGDYNLTEGDRISISFKLDENNASIIHDIEKLE